MERDITLANLLRLAIKAEETAEVFYRRLAEKFFEFDEISTLWEKMAEDENAHVRYIENIRESLTPAQLDADTDFDLLRKANEVVKFSADELLNSVKTLNEAYNLAHDIEHSEVNYVFRFLINKFADSEQVKKFAIAQLKEHLDRLMNFGKKFGAEFRESVPVCSKKPDLQPSDK